MNIAISDKKSFISRFLTPINKLNENIILKVNPDNITSVSSSQDGTCIIYSTFRQANPEVTDQIRLNVPDISRLIKVLSCVNDSDIGLKYSGNSVKYESASTRFTYHLLEDGIISTPAVSIEKIKQLDFDINFDISKQHILSLIKASTFTTESDKIYFSAKDGSVYCELTDRERQNVDSFSIEVSNEVSGTGNNSFSPLAINFEILRAISSIQFDAIKVYINISKNVFLFDIDIDNISINIIASGYIQ